MIWICFTWYIYTIQTRKYANGSFFISLLLSLFFIINWDTYFNLYLSIYLSVHFGDGWCWWYHQSMWPTFALLLYWNQVNYKLLDHIKQLSQHHTTATNQSYFHDNIWLRYLNLLYGFNWDHRLYQTPTWWTKLCNKYIHWLQEGVR